jgi:hypothetical protein
MKSREATQLRRIIADLVESYDVLVKDSPLGKNPIAVDVIRGAFKYVDKARAACKEPETLPRGNRVPLIVKVAAKTPARLRKIAKLEGCKSVGEWLDWQGDKYFPCGEVKHIPYKDPHP